MRAARRRASAGPRAMTAPIRSPGAAGLVSERTWTTCPSGSSPNSGGGAGAEREIAERVVLDQERARGADRLEDGRAALDGERRPVRVGEHRLQVDEPRAGALERVGEQVGPDAALVGRHRDRDEALRPRRGERAEVGRRLDDHRRARRREPAQARREPRLPARADQHVAGRRADLRREVRPQPADALRAGRGPTRPAGAPRGRAPRRAPRSAAGRRADSRVESTNASGAGGRSSVSSASASIARAPSATVCHDASADRRRDPRAPRTSRAPAAPRPARARPASRSPAAPSPARPDGAPSARARTAAGRPARPAATTASSAVTIAPVLLLNHEQSRVTLLRARRGNASAPSLWGFVGRAGVLVLAAGDAAGGRGSRPDVRRPRARARRRRARRGAARGPARAVARAQDLPRFALVGHRRRDRLPDLHLARAAPPLVGARQRHRRPAAGRDGGVGGRPRGRAAPARVLGGGRRGAGRRARVRRDAGRERDRRRRPARARRGRVRRARVRRGRRAEPHLRRLAGDLLGARADRAVSRRSR